MTEKTVETMWVENVQNIVNLNYLEIKYVIEIVILKNVIMMEVIARNIVVVFVIKVELEMVIVTNIVSMRIVIMTLEIVHNVIQVVEKVK